MTWQLPIIAIPPRPGAAPACSDAGLLAIAQGLRSRRQTRARAEPSMLSTNRANTTANMFTLIASAVFGAQVDIPGIPVIRYAPVVAERGHEQETAAVCVAGSQGFPAGREPSAGRPAPGSSPRFASSVATLSASASVVSWGSLMSEIGRAHV